MKFHETGNRIPEMDDLEMNEVNLLNYDNGTFLAAMTIRDSLVYVTSNNEVFDNLWIPTSSLLFANNLKQYRSEDLIKLADRKNENLYFTTSMIMAHNILTHHYIYRAKQRLQNTIL